MSLIPGRTIDQLRDDVAEHCAKMGYGTKEALRKFLDDFAGPLPKRNG